MVGSKRTRSKTVDMVPVIGTTLQPAELAAETIAPASTVVMPSQGPVAGSSHLHSTAAEHGGTSHQGGLTTIADLGPILEQLQAFPPLPPRSMHAPVYTSNETLALCNWASHSSLLPLHEVK
ncbi:unnamed protein product [Prunus armeniaca]